MLERLRSGGPLSAKELAIHEQGLVSILRQLHDELDTAVLDAYGWSDLVPLLRFAHGNDSPIEGKTRDEAKRAFDEAILKRLVALNTERAAEEARGLVRWLRPEVQNPEAQATERAPEQASLNTESLDESENGKVAPTAVIRALPWPKDALAQVRVVADVLASSLVPQSLDDIAARFTARGPWKRRVPQILDMLVALGRAREHKGRFSAN